MNDTLSFSDDPHKVWLSPKTCRAARGLLFWTQQDLALKSGVDIQQLRLFEEYGVAALSSVEMGAVLKLLLSKVRFSTHEGMPGVCLKGEVTKAQGPGVVVFGGPLRRCPKL